MRLKFQKEWFLPHRAVVRENAESTKIRVVYDVLAESESGYSLNDCYENDCSTNDSMC